MTDDPLKHGRIPIEPIRRILSQWGTTIDYEDAEKSRKDVPLPLAPIARLAGYIGVKEDTLYSISGRRDRQHVSFDIADKIIAWIDPGLWHTDPELRAIYDGFSFDSLEIQSPTTHTTEVMELLEAGVRQKHVAALCGVKSDTISRHMKKVVPAPIVEKKAPGLYERTGAALDRKAA